MLKTFRIIAFTLIAAFLSVSASHAGAGFVSSIEGYVTATNSKGEVRRLEVGDTLEEGETIDTGNDSSATITLQNGELVSIGSTSRYKLSSVKNNGVQFAARRFAKGSFQTLSTATAAGGVISTEETGQAPSSPNDDIDAPTTPGSGGSPTN